ncbi:MAG: CYTH domain-containing protein [Leptolyngbya sp. PLA1]|nr:CYTH domain-containing protein [Leptolyngbya sp. PLA1]
MRLAVREERRTEMHNVEFKAELRDLNLARSLCVVLGARKILDFDQTDTYFRVASGRLKKRETPGEPTEYVYYDRANRAAAKLSRFMIYSEEQALERFGREPLPVWVVVRKHRDLWMHGHTRIHLDQVEGLGTFIEFEALISRDHNISRGHEAVAALREHFSPVIGETIDCSYSDMVARDEDHKAELRP